MRKRVPKPASTASPKPSLEPPPQASSKTGTLVAASWTGPLPPPAALEQFDRIIPNGAERIMSMCEREQKSRLDKERIYALTEVTIEISGRIVGGLLVLVCVGAAIWSIHLKADWKVTLGFLSLPIMGAIAKLFERGRKR